MKTLVINIILLLLFGGKSISAQHNKINVGIGADIVSSYVWRGSLCASTSIQPTIYATVRGFTAITSGSVDIAGRGYKEVDLALSYSKSNFTIGITDYWWHGESVFEYFNLQSGRTNHLIEGNLKYKFPFEQFQLSIAWNTMLYGKDYITNNKQAYSTYIELDYPFGLSGIEMNATCGFVPWTSPIFVKQINSGFNICNIGMSAAKSFTLLRTSSLKVYNRLIFNPAIEGVYLVFGVSLLL